MPKDTIPPFQGYAGPNFTPIPDQLFDEQLADLSGAELKVLLYIMRRTFGFKRDADAISLSQLLHGIVTKEGRVLDRGTGLSKPTLLQTLRSLVEKNIVITQRRRSQERGDEPTIYRLNIAPLETTSSTTPPPVVKKLNHGVVKKSLPPVVKKFAPQETGRQETDSSNLRRLQPEDLPEPPTEQQPTHTVSQGIEPLSTVLSRRRSRLAVTERDARLAIESAVREIAHEFHDRAPLKSSAARARNLMREAEVAAPAFIATLYEARAVTNDRLRSGTAGRSVRNAMGFFFAVLEDRLGLREPTAEEPDSPTDT